VTGIEARVAGASDGRRIQRRPVTGRRVRVAGASGRALGPVSVAVPAE